MEVQQHSRVSRAARAAARECALIDELRRIFGTRRAVRGREVFSVFVLEDGRRVSARRVDALRHLGLVEREADERGVWLRRTAA